MMKSQSSAISLPLLPLLDGAVLLPGGFLRVRAGAERSAALVEHLLSRRAPIGALADVAAIPLSASPAPPHPDPSPDDQDHGDLDLDRLYGYGSAARVIELVRAPGSDDWVMVLEGRCRVKVLDISLGGGQRRDLHVARVKQLDYLSPGAHARDAADAATKEEAELQRQLLRGVRAMFTAAGSTGARPELGSRTLQILKNYGPALTSDIVGSLLAQNTRQRLALLSTVEPVKRLRTVNALMQHRLAVAGLSSKPPSSAASPRSSHPSTAAAGPREDSDSEDDANASLQRGGEAKALLSRLKAANPPAEVLDAALREYRRLKRTNEAHPGYAAALTYLETLSDLPWGRRAAGQGARPPRLDAVRARLDADHFGLDKVKERITQFVAVQALRGWDARAPVLCLVGPPGVGKTSVARSMAAALGRPFQRISLGGVRDEAEIRGHRRTYVGALPGRVIAALRRAAACDAVLLLDEVDKAGRDVRGDPAAALLEVLDPEQNSAFVDAYLGVPVDLSSVVFIATANAAADIPPPLLDRMEVVNLGGYTVAEKIGIAEAHLVPKALAEHGLAPETLVVPQASLRLLVEGYTREAGVRQLAQRLAAICRHVAVKLVAEAEAAGMALPVPPTAAAAPVEGGGALGNSPGDEPLPGGSASDLAAALGAFNSSEASASNRTGWLSSWLGRQRGSVSKLSSSENRPAAAFEGATATPEETLHVGAGGGGGGGGGQGPTPSLRLLGPGSMGLISTASASATGNPTDSGPSLPLPPSALAPDLPLPGGPSALPLPIIVDETLIREVLGPRRYHGHDAAQRVATPGAAAGLVWTPAGGAVQYIEALMVGTGSSNDPGSLTLTGSLGDVLEESARIAVSWCRAHAAALGLPPGPRNPAAAWDVHVHLPSGGQPKDGPSAGVTLAVALVSLFTGRACRADVALTGELTLRGLVLPVGGVKEKVIAAAAAGMRRVILPAGNLAEATAEVLEEVRAGVELVPVERLEQALEAAFDPPLHLDTSAVPGHPACEAAATMYEQ